MNSTVHPESDEDTTHAEDKKRKRIIGVILGTLGVISGIAIVVLTTSVTDDPGSPAVQELGQLKSSTHDPGEISTVAETDECKSNPCLNGGTCEETGIAYTCHCTIPYEGPHCEIDVDECQSEPCFNGGTCEDLLGGYTCDCSAPYEGVHCQIENTCLPNPCLNDGTCSFNAAHENHTCSCIAGFTGTVCETNIDDCLPGACYGGKCIDGINQYHCDCSDTNDIDFVNIAWNKWAIQSSTHDDNYASRAVDDVINPDALEGLSCAVTSNVIGEESWWKVDLGQVSCVARVIISNRHDCCAEIISGAEIWVSSHYDMAEPRSCGTVQESMATNKLIDLECDLSTIGRYLEIRLPREAEKLALCEVKVIAPDLTPSPAPAVKYTAACPSGWKHFSDKCYYFGTNRIKWIDADVYCQSQGGQLVKDTRDVHGFLSSEVATLNKAGCSPLFSCNPYIGMTYRPYEGYKWSDGTNVDQSFMPWQYGEPNDGNVAKIVEIELRSSDWSRFRWNDKSFSASFPESWFICEKTAKTSDSTGCEDLAQCFGESCGASVDSEYLCDCDRATVNVAFGRLTWQSSSHPNGPADKAVDGYTIGYFPSGKCSLTGEGVSNPWWRVDLAEQHCVKKVVIFTRSDCCQERLVGGKVFVSKNAALTDATQCGPTVSYSMSQQNNIDFNCDQGSVGRFVHFEQRDQELIALCEVRVYAPARGRYQPVMMWRTHADAQAHCAAQSVGGHLARLTSLDQHDYVVGLIRQSGREGETDYWWVDGSYQAHQGWNFSDNSIFRFTAWHADGTSVLDETRCLRLSKHLGYLWDAAQCTDVGYFICRRYD
ncbi:uncharacterized protein [Ptychodera flava]|uniref:uncharacterized protein n=1 Tax=Ptychodera flava TaxID=63121 RepID=UPI00396A06B3